MTFRRRLRRAHSGDLTLSMSVTAGTYVGDSTSAVSGVAPLYVHFDATATTSTQTTEPHAAVMYLWDFGDPTSGNYAYGAFANTDQASRNVGKGVVTGHVFDAPGTYTVTCLGYDGASLSTHTITVTVTDGSANEWAGERTILISTTGGAAFTCAGLTGTPDTRVTSSVSDAQILANATANTTSIAGNSYGKGPVRLLYRRGESFDVNSSLVGAGNGCKSPSGPYYVGSYDDNGVGYSGVNATIVGGTGAATYGLLQVGQFLPSATYATMKGFTAQDLTLDGSAITGAPSSGYGVRFWGNCQWRMLRRITTDHCNAALMLDTVFQLPSNGALMWDGTAVVDCVTTNGEAGRNNIGIFLDSSRAYVAGCYFKSQIGGSGGGHNIRCEWFNKLTIEHTTLEDTNSTQDLLKMHSDNVLSWGATVGLGSQAASSTTNYGQGDYIRPWNPVQTGLIAQGAEFPVFRCTTGGTCGASQPTWNTTLGATTTDGTVVWTCVDASTITPDKATWRSDGNKYSSTYAVVRGMKFDNGVTPWPVAIGSLDDDDYTKVKKVMFFDNWFLSSNNVADVGIQCWSEDIHIYNNLFDFTDADGSAPPQFVFVGARTPPSSVYSASKVRIYNNTFYSGALSVTSTITGVKVDPYATDVIVKNNLMYLAGTAAAATPTMVDDSTAAPGEVTEGNNTGDVGTATTDPKFSGVLTAYTGWQITDGTSYTKNAGANVPVWRDYLGNVRNAGEMDIGASEQ
jgi:hypothetical protein